MKTKQEIKEEISDLYAAQKAFSEAAEFAHNWQVQQMAAIKKMIALNQMLKDMENDNDH
jgi:hypothetical protein